MIVTRFAPSPTGMLHIGGARTALFNWLYAKHMGGRFLLRIEDTDRVRSTQEAVDAILTSLRWLGLTWDGDYVLQSSRLERHKEVAMELLRRGSAYKCYATREEIEQFHKDHPYRKFVSPWREAAITAKEGTPYVIRIKAALDGEAVVNDSVQGSVAVGNDQLDDMVLLRADGTPTYMMAVVVDDHDMGVNTVIRGDDHFTNAFRQNQIYDAMGWDKPSYAHIPLIHGADGSKLSKRHGAMGVGEYKEMGYLPEAITSYLVRLGWSHGDDEIISTDQAIKWFELSALGKSPARFDLDKLNHINAHYIKESSVERLTSLLKDVLGEDAVVWSRIEAGVSLLQNRVSTLKGLIEASQIFVSKHIPITDAAQGACDNVSEEGRRIIAHKINNIATWDVENISAASKELVTLMGVKMPVIMQYLRATIIGSLDGPGIVEIMALLGKEEVQRRMLQI